MTRTSARVHRADEQVMSNGSRRMGFPDRQAGRRAEEPDRGYRSSTRSAGVQHHRRGRNIIETVSLLKGPRREFSTCRRPTTTTCWTAWADRRDLAVLEGAWRVGGPRRRGLPVAALHQAGAGPPTMFFEIIQRKARNFGKGNFRRCSRPSSGEQENRGRFEHPERSGRKQEGHPRRMPLLHSLSGSHARRGLVQLGHGVPGPAIRIEGLALPRR